MATRTADSPDFDDVSAALNGGTGPGGTTFVGALVDGDTLNIPSGSANWCVKITDGVITNGSATVTSASANFIATGNATDVFHRITCSVPGIPDNTFIGVVNSTNSIGLSSSSTVNTPITATATVNPATIYLWGRNRTLVVSGRNIKIMGAGSGVAALDTSSSTHLYGGALFDFETIASVTTPYKSTARLSGFWLTLADNKTGGPAIVLWRGFTVPSFAGDNTAQGGFRFDHWQVDVMNSFGSLNRYIWDTGDWCHGVIDHFQITRVGPGNENIEVRHGSKPTSWNQAGQNGSDIYSHWSWSQPIDYNNVLEAVYIEDGMYNCATSYPFGVDAGENDSHGSGGRYVARHNTWGSTFSGHGTESGNGRSLRFHIIQQNRINVPQAFLANHSNVPIESRGGSGMYTGNYLTATKYFKFLGYFAGAGSARVLTGGGSRVNGSADGRRHWDNNHQGPWTSPSTGKVIQVDIAHTDPLESDIYFHGSSFTQTTGSLTIILNDLSSSTTTSLASGDLCGMVLRDENRVGQGGSSAMIVSSTAAAILPGSVTVTLSASGAPNINLSAGPAGYSIGAIDQYLDCLGAGACDATFNDTGSYAYYPTDPSTLIPPGRWSNQAVEGLYLWNNWYRTAYSGAGSTFTQMSVANGTYPAPNSSGTAFQAAKWNPDNDISSTGESFNPRPGQLKISSPTTAQRRVGADWDGDPSPILLNSSDVYLPIYPHPLVTGSGTVTPTKVIRLTGNMAFGTVSTTASSVLTIHNDGNTAFNFTDITFTDGASNPIPQYTRSVSSGTVNPLSSVTSTITFTPTALTSYPGTLTVVAAGTTGINTIAISGNGTTPTTLSMSLTGTLSFGSVQLHSSSAKLFTINNTGNADFTVANISDGVGDGVYTFDFTTGTVVAGTSKDVHVTFAPSAPVSYNRTITVTTVQVVTGSPGTIAATGSGTARKIYFKYHKA